jgi:hypothetical protein
VPGPDEQLDGGPDALRTDWLDSGPARQRRPRAWRLAGLATAVAVALATLVVVLVSRNPAWPSRCGVEGHEDWCRSTSVEMAGSALAAVVRGYCPGLRPGAGDVEPQPLSLADLGSPDTLVRVTEDPTAGTEDALLGRPESFSWVTRWVGGPEGGRVELRCPGGTSRVPGLRLAADQFRSTAAAARGTPRRLDFRAVARAAVRSQTPQRRVSFGFLTCDTRSVHLAHPRAGSRFRCTVEAYWPQGMGAYPQTFMVTRERPYFRMLDG